MHTEQIAMTKAEALALYRKYKAHQAYAAPIDWEIQRTYQLLSRGNVIIRAIESIKTAGVNEKALPRLALAPATATACHIQRQRDGSMIMGPNDDFWRARKNQYRFPEETFTFPYGSFPPAPWQKDGRDYRSAHRALLPIIPVDLRPRRALENYHVLWEAEWERIPPRDPYLLRRIGKADLWLVVAHWDLTEVERAALSTRIVG